MRVYPVPAASKALGTMFRDRQSLVAVLNQMRDQLENHSHLWRGCRYPDDQDLFIYTTNIFDVDTWHTIIFVVDDRQANDGILAIIDVKDVPREPL